MDKTFQGFIQSINNRYRNSVLFHDGRYEMHGEVTGSQYNAIVAHTAEYLLQKNLGAGKKIVSFIESGIFWNVIDMAVMCSGGVHVALSPTLENEDISKFIAYLKPSAVVYGNPFIEKRIRKALASEYHGIFLIDAKQVIEGLDISTATGLLPAVELRDNSVATIMFTSGTSGSAKGILHTHERMVQNIQQTVSFYGFEQGVKALSFLPLHYAYERMYNYVFQQSGVAVHYANPSKSIWENIIEEQPSLVTIVPVFLIELNNILRGTEHRDTTGLINWIRVKQPVFICSGAPLSQDVYQSLTATGCLVYDMYGSTETLIVSANSVAQFEAGSVGKVIETGRVKIAEDGEVLVKNIMQGYCFPSELLADSPYYHTGDLGSLENGFLKIAGRKKMLFKNAHGVYINPVEIEARLNNTPGVKNLLVTEHLGGIAIIIEPNHPQFPEMEDSLLFIREFNVGQPVNKLIKYIAFSDVMWSAENGFLTISSKPKREYIVEHFRNKLIEISE